MNAVFIGACRYLVERQYYIIVCAMSYYGSVVA